MNYSEHFVYAHYYKITVDKDIYAQNRELFMRFMNRHIEDGDTLIIAGSTNFIVKEAIDRLLENNVLFDLELRNSDKVIFSTISSPRVSTSSFAFENLIIKWRYDRLRYGLTCLLASAAFLLLVCVVLIAFTEAYGILFAFFAITVPLGIWVIHLSLNYYRAKNTINADPIYNKIKNRENMAKLNDDLIDLALLKGSNFILTNNYLIFTHAFFTVYNLSTLVYISSFDVEANSIGIKMLFENGQVKQEPLDNYEQAKRLSSLIGERYHILHDEKHITLETNLMGEVKERQLVQRCLDYKKSKK